MGDLASYRNTMVDNSRWERLEHRPGDIVISTPPKSGTTWTQMLCALMIFDGPDFHYRDDRADPVSEMVRISDLCDLGSHDTRGPGPLRRTRR